MECQICCEKFNMSTRRKVNCNYCEYSPCRSCFQRYLTETTLDPHCMNCKKGFTYEFVSETCTSVFVNKALKKHRENVLFDREKALLPITQNDVLIEKERRNIKIQMKDNLEEQYKLKIKLSRLNNEHRILNNRYHTIETGESSTSSSSEVKKFIRKCPVADCRGFLSTKWKCGTCETNICNKCNEVNDITHIECKPENVATMELINKDTKPCPKCGTMIFKISGCLQIFCVDCHTAWSWDTGRIETGVIHNPHYYDFLRKQNNGIIPRNPGDVPCGRLPDYYYLQQSFRTKKFILKSEITVQISNVHQLISHIQRVELRRYQLRDNNTFKKERVLYLLNELSENDFKKTLQQREKRNDKNREFSQVYQMFIDVGTDTLIKIFEATSSDEVIVHTKVFEPLTKYFNESLCRIAKRYKCVYPGITNSYHFEQNYESYLRKVAN